MNTLEIREITTLVSLGSSEMAKYPQITDNTLIRRNPNQMFSKIDDEVVMLSIQKGEYYNINDVGAKIWNLIENKRRFVDIVEYLVSSYDVPIEKCKIETSKFLLELEEKGVIELSNEKMV